MISRKRDDVTLTTFGSTCLIYCKCLTNQVGDIIIAAYIHCTDVAS